jgi:hypothetical protein
MTPALNTSINGLICCHFARPNVLYSFAAAIRAEVLVAATIPRGLVNAGVCCSAWMIGSSRFWSPFRPAAKPVTV